VRAAVLLLLATCALHAERRYQVAHYEVRIAPDLAAWRLSGTETIRFRQASGPIELDAGALEIQSVTQDGRAVAFERRGSLLLIAGERPTS
jgi:aminopeptidase N